jgi:glucose/arabinose dehydrogenase
MLQALILVFTVAASLLVADRVRWTSSRFAGSPEPPPPCLVEPAFPQIHLTNPVQIAKLPGSDRWIALEQAGRILSFVDRPDAAQVDLVLNLRQHHQPFDSVYSIAFHPRFASNHFAYVCYVEPGGRTNGSFVSRFTVRVPADAATPPTIDPTSELPIIRWYSGGHNGGDLRFGPDGMLYVSTGDAANPDPPDENRTGQGVNDLLSCILRIDVDHPSGEKNYSIPADNPFAKTPDARGEIFAFGFGNPWRTSFGPDGALYVGDVGREIGGEMIHRVQSGGNHGGAWWRGQIPMCGRCRGGPGADRAPLVFIRTAKAASITGGLHYRGKRLPRLAGTYVYGDWETGKILGAATRRRPRIADEEICDTANKIVSLL